MIPTCLWFFSLLLQFSRFFKLLKYQNIDHQIINTGYLKRELGIAVVFSCEETSIYSSR